MSNSINNLEDSTKDAKNCTNNFTNNTILNNSFKPPNLNSQTMPNTAPNMQPKTNFTFPVLINPAVLNNPNFKQMYPQMYSNMNMMNNTNNTTNPINNNANSANSNPNPTPMKIPVMPFPVIFSPMMFGSQDQTPVGERCKIWIGKIPDGISETFMKKLLECCGQVTSWRRVTNSSGKLNSFGFCEYSTVESILKCLRLLNGYPLLGSELQVKIGSDTEEFLKKWRERKKIEWINSMTVQGIPVNLDEIKKKEENNEPLEWELRLVANDQEILKTLNEIVSQRQCIDNKGKQTDNDIFLKDLNDLANSNILENKREKERKQKKLEKQKKFEKLFNDFEKNWLKHESNREKEKIKLQKEKENLPNKKKKLLEKDLQYDSDKEKKYNEVLKGIGNKGYKMSTSFINKKKNEERMKIREKEREYDNALREKENQMLFKNIGSKDNYLLETENLDNLLDTNKILAIASEEKKPTTTFEIEDYNSNSNPIDSTQNIGSKDKDKEIKESKKDDNHHIQKEEEEEINTKNDKKVEISNNKNKENNQKDNNKEDIKEKMDEEIDEIKIENMNLEKLLNGVPDVVYFDIQNDIKNNLIPTKEEELFKYKIDWDFIAKYEIKRKKIKKCVEKKLLDYFDEVDSFTKFILEKLGVLTPAELQEKLKYVLEEHTEVST